MPSLVALLESNHDVVAVVTAPDRPRGRGMRIEPSPVKNKALEMGLSVLQPSTLWSDEFRETLTTLGADIFVVTAYGLILPGSVLNVPALGCVNVHFSLLPRFRGAAPVQWALIEGQDLTGVTIMQMDEGLDTGPILSQLSEPIREDDDAASLQNRLALRGSELLVETLDLIIEKAITPAPQDDSLATVAPKLSTDDAHTDWSLSATEIHNRVRAFSPRPGAWNKYRDGRLKIFRVAITDEPSGDPPGTLAVRDEELLAASGTTLVALREVQPEGKRPMTGSEFVRGYRPGDTERLS